MARNRITAPNLAVFVGPTPITGVHSTGTIRQLLRLQSVSYDFSLQKEDVLQLGNTAPISREQSDVPNVSLNLSYYLSSFDNEFTLGLNPVGTQSAIKYLLDKTRDEKNYFVFVAPEGADAAGLTAADGQVKGFGNGYISSYSIEGAVGSFPTASVQVLCSNMVGFSDGVAQTSPAINTTTGFRVSSPSFTLPTVRTNASGSQPKVIRPGDITVDLTNAGGLYHQIGSGCVQSFSVSFDLNRQNQTCLGSYYPRSRDIDPPVNVNFQVEVLANDLVTGDLANFICLTGTNYTANVKFKTPSCNGNTGSEYLGLTLKNLSLESQSWNASVGGGAQTVSLNWIGQVGGSGDSANGLFMSGVYLTGSAWDAGI